MDRGHVAVEGHRSEDVRADDLAVGVERRDDGAHGGSEVPGAVAQQLVDEERHPEEEQEIDDGQIQDEDVRNGLLGAALGLLHDGEDDNAVPHDTQEADDAEDDGEDGTAVEGPVCSSRREKGTEQQLNIKQMHKVMSVVLNHVV